MWPSDLTDWTISSVNSGHLRSVFCGQPTSVLTLLLEVAGKFSMSSLGCEHFLQDCKNGCEGTWCDSPNPSDQPFAIDCT